MTDEDGASLSEKFNLNVMDMKYLRSFEAIEAQNQTYQDVYKKHLFKVSHNTFMTTLPWTDRQVNKGSPFTSRTGT